MALVQVYLYSALSHQLSFLCSLQAPQPSQWFLQGPQIQSCLLSFIICLISRPYLLSPSVSPSSRKMVLISLTDPPAPQAAAAALFPSCFLSLGSFHQPKSPLKVGGFQNCFSRYPASAGCTDVSMFLKDGCPQLTWAPTCPCALPISLWIHWKLPIPLLSLLH